MSVANNNILFLLCLILVPLKAVRSQAAKDADTLRTYLLGIKPFKKEIPTSS